MAPLTGGLHDSTVGTAPLQALSAALKNTVMQSRTDLHWNPCSIYLE